MVGYAFAADVKIDAPDSNDDLSKDLQYPLEILQNELEGNSKTAGFHPILGSDYNNKPTETVDEAMTKAQVAETVAAAVRALDDNTVDALSHYKTHIADAHLVAVEVETNAIDVHSDGRFMGRANLLVTVPFIGFNGRLADTRASLAIPADVQGAVSDEGVSVQKMLVLQ